MYAGIKDSEFIRGKVPMTKEEIRILSIAKLQLAGDSVLYDIGAGTGSVSVEAALQHSKGIVYAIERNAAGIDLIRANRDKFKISNMEVVEGEAPECLDGLPAPTHVFIGGSGGRLIEIIRAVREQNNAARFVVNAVTLETIGELRKIRDVFPEYSNMEIVQIGVSRSKEMGGYHMMCAENPVYIASF